MGKMTKIENTFYFLFSCLLVQTGWLCMCEMKRWPFCSVVGQWIMGYSGGLWGWGDGSPFCVWSRSGYIHAHRATAVVHLVEALITTPPHLHTHAHYSITKHTEPLTWDFLDCCSLPDLFISIIYFSHFCSHVSPCRNEPRFLLLQTQTSGGKKCESPKHHLQPVITFKNLIKKPDTIRSP